MHNLNSDEIQEMKCGCFARFLNIRGDWASWLLIEPPVCIDHILDFVEAPTENFSYYIVRNLKPTKNQETSS